MLHVIKFELSKKWELLKVKFLKGTWHIVCQVKTCLCLHIIKHKFVKKNPKKGFNTQFNLLFLCIWLVFHINQHSKFLFKFVDVFFCLMSSEDTFIQPWIDCV